VTAIRVRGLSAGYQGAAVVRDLDLDVSSGEVVALLGPNGAGKTTTLLALSGLLRPMAGTVEVLGRCVRAGKPHAIARRGLAHVPEDRALFSNLTVRQNLTLARGSERGIVDRVLSLFPELTPHLGRRAGTLSGGEQQMLALGRALACRPKVLLVDELSLGLAPVVVRRQLPRLRRIADETGAAVLFVEQHVKLALEIADTAHVMVRGQLVFSGPAHTLEDRADLIHASYLGPAHRVEDAAH
jgi:branched-chain amino acid transport system ATP-binding protein